MFMWAGRTRPQVRKLMFPSRSGECSLKETKPASRVPISSQSDRRRVKHQDRHASRSVDQRALDLLDFTRRNIDRTGRRFQRNLSGIHKLRKDRCHCGNKSKKAHDVFTGAGAGVAPRQLVTGVPEGAAPGLAVDGAGEAWAGGAGGGVITIG